MELVGIAEIAEIANVSRQAVSNWSGRDASFPKPVAQLACGDIWSKSAIMDWLRSSKRLPGVKDSSEVQSFKIGQFYSHDDINKVFGGNPNTYLRLRAGRISCGCFNALLNPMAPEEILVGTGPQIERSAELLMEQGEAIPVFIKRGVNQWQYQGIMQPLKLERDPARVSRKAEESGQKNISSILFFKSVKD